MATKQYLASDCSNLLSLRNLLKRDPDAYSGEFQQQAAHLRSLVATNAVDLTDITGIVENNGGDPGASRAQTQHDRHFADVIEFVSHCLPLYWHTLSDVRDLPKMLLEMLKHRAATMSPALRKSTVQALALLRNRGVQSSMELMPVWFSLLEIPDKALRLLVFGDLVSNIIRIEEKSSGAEQRAHRCFVYDLINDKRVQTDGAERSEVQSLKALGVAAELFRKNIWRNEKTANIMSEAVFSPSSKMTTAALRFLLCDSFTDDDDQEGGEKLGLSIRAAVSKIRENRCGANVGSKKKKRERAIERAKEKIKKVERKQELGPKLESGPILMIYDPQTFAERLFSKLRTTKEAFSVRQLMMSVISRFVNEHSLFLLNLYPFLQRYLQAHVKNVTTIMSFLVQSCHSKIPPDVLEPILKAIADQFVNDRSRPEAMAVGINSIRAICARQPLCMSATLLQDLAQYKDHRDKSVVMAARSLIGLFRQVNPLLLHKKDRGRITGDIPVQKEYCEEHIPADVPDVHLLHTEEAESLPKEEWDQNESMSENSDEDDDDDDIGSDSDDSLPSLVDEEEAAELHEKIAAADTLEKQSSLPLGAMEILTPADFELLEKLKKQKQTSGSTCRAYSEEGSSVTPEDLEASVKRKRRLLEERLDLIKANQKERKLTFMPGGQKGGNSATNEEKKRLKPFMLTKHSQAVREKQKDSQLTKQFRSGNHAGKKRKSAKNSHRKKRRRF